MFKNKSHLKETYLVYRLHSLDRKIDNTIIIFTLQLKCLLLNDILTKFKNPDRPYLI